MRKVFITNNSKQTQKLGEMLAAEIISSQKRTDRSPAKARPKADRPFPAFIICLEGDLGSGKTTFTQGLLNGLGAKGPYTSPTFVIMKQYKRITHIANRIAQNKKTIRDTRSTLRDMYHIDAYRVGVKDILNLGWKELVAEKENIIIIEWADRVRKIIPKKSFWIKFEWVDQDRRKITFK